MVESRRSLTGSPLSTTEPSELGMPVGVGWGCSTAHYRIWYHHHGRGKACAKHAEWDIVAAA